MVQAGMKINFIATDSFLRTAAKTDPFYDPIIKVVEREERVEWKIFVSHKGVASGYSRNRIDNYWWFEWLGIWFYKICRVFAWRVEAWKIYKWFGILSRPIFARKFNADVVITQSGQFAEVFLGLLPLSRIVDIQHGVIYSRHNGYFSSDSRLLPIFQESKNREFWLFGQGYADCFFKHPDNANDLQGRVKVIGDVIRAGESVGADGCRGRDETRDVVVFSLQLTADLSQDEMSGSVTRMEAFFADFFAKYGDKYKCFVKHHPRFNNVYDLSAFYAKFPQVTETKVPWTELYPKMALHVTFNSTVTFDCASQGIPTFLVDYPEAKVIMRNFYRDDYGYPVYDKSVDDILGSPIEETRRTIIDWYHRFYTPFSEENCLKLLKGMK